MPLLARVFLRDLQFDGFVRVLKTAQQGRNRLTHLEVDRPVVDLDDDVIFKLPIQRVKDVVGSLRAIIFEIAPIQMMVVNKGTIEKHTALRFERECDDIRGVGWRSPVAQWTKPPFGIRLDDKTSKVGDLLEDVFDLL